MFHESCKVQSDFTTALSENGDVHKKQLPKFSGHLCTHDTHSNCACAYYCYIVLSLFLVLPAHFSGVTRGQARSSEVRTVGHSISVCLCQGKAHGSITETDRDEDQCWNRMFIGAMLFVAHRQLLLALNGNNAYYMYGDISDELRSSPL